MIAPVKRLTKRELEWLGGHYCRHRCTYLSHYNCFLDEKPEQCEFIEKVGYLDIEATNLKADFGYIFSYAIKDRESNKMYGRVLTSPEIRRFIFDRNLMAEFLRDVKNFHRIVTYYGSRFDLPFIRTRCLKFGLQFPEYQDLYQTDCYYMVRNKLNLHRSRLESACQFFNIPAKQHPLNPDIWLKALAGDKESLEYIWLHNKEDVISLEQVHKLLENYSKNSKVSI